MSISISDYPVYLQDGLKLNRGYLKSQGNQNEDQKVFYRDSLEVSQLRYGVLLIQKKASM